MPHPRRLPWRWRLRLFLLVLWSISFGLHFIAKPILYYLTWSHNAINLVPGVFIGGIWALLIEGLFFEHTFLQIASVLKLENDITGESFQQEQDLLPS
jgi:hypothetical protein